MMVKEKRKKEWKEKEKEEELVFEPVVVGPNSSL